MSPQQNEGRVFGLDALRAGAILLVLISHTWPVKVGFNWSTAAGVLGVELFFVLSGFLIGGILFRLAETQKFQTWGHLFGFWKRRWFRTLPNYYLFLGLQIVFYVWVREGADKVVSVFLPYAFFLQNIDRPPGFEFQESWSLAVEEWFYLLFAFALWLALKLTARPGRAVVVIIGIFLIVPMIVKIQLAWVGFGRYPNESDEFWRIVWEYNFHKPVIARLDVLMYGVAGAVIAVRRPEFWRWLAGYWWWGLLLLGVAVSSVALDWPLDRAQVFEGLLIWPCLAVALTMLVCRCSLIGEKSGWLAGVLRFIAKISYSLYLTQGMAVLCMGFFGPHSFFPLPEYTWRWALAIWVLSIGSAWLVNRWFEKPMMDLRDRNKDKTVR